MRNCNETNKIKNIKKEKGRELSPKTINTTFKSNTKKNSNKKDKNQSID